MQDINLTASQHDYVFSNVIFTSQNRLHDLYNSFLNTDKMIR